MTDIDFLAGQIQQILTELGNVRADMRVLTAMVMRLDNTIQTIPQELHEIHSWMIRVDDRVHKLEGDGFLPG